MKKTAVLAACLLCLPAALSAKKAPSLKISTDFPYFSPNKNGVRDDVVFQIRVQNIKNITTWEIQFKDASGIVRRTLASTQDLPPVLAWEGVDEFGALSPEGTYEVILRAWDKNQQVYEADPLKVTLDLTPPTISLTSSVKRLSPKEAASPSVPFYFSAVDLSGIRDWRFVIGDEKKKELHVEASSGSLPSSWTFAPKSLPSGLRRITGILTVTDRAGNSANSAPLDIELDGESAAERAPAAAAPAPAADGSAPPARAASGDGPFLQMTSIMAVADLFGDGADSDTPLLPQAAVLLGPVARALQDSPGSRVLVLGHVDALPNLQDSRALSSAFAWKVFSYFVKESGIDSKRVSVKGLGADVPISDNRTPLGRARNRRVELQLFFPANSH